MSSTFDLYRVTGTAGKVGTPGAPILHFELLVNASTGSISGQAQITQAIAPPNNVIDIKNVTGKALTTIFGGKITLHITLQGTYNQPGPPGTNFIILENFSAAFITDQQWDGSGGFEYGNGTHVVNDVPVKSSKASVSPIHTLYGVVIHGAAASGDLARMKEVAAKADQYISQVPDVQKALDALKTEIKKAGG
jgi:hypothetical protein